MTPNNVIHTTGLIAGQTKTNIGEGVFRVFKEASDVYAHMNVPVSAIDLHYNRRENGFEEQVQTGYKAVVDDVTGSIYHVGTQYKPIHMNQVLESVRVLESRGMEVVRGEMYDRKQFKITMVLPDKVVNFRVGERDYPTKFLFTVVNSYDGTSALRINYGGKIEYCQNQFGLPTARVQSALGGKARIRHVGDIDNAWKYINESLETGLDIWEDLLNKTWNVLPLSKIQDNLHKSLPDTVPNRMLKTLVENKAKAEAFGSLDFDYFMASTNITTNAEENGLNKSQVEGLTKFSESFFLN